MVRAVVEWEEGLVMGRKALVEEAEAALETVAERMGAV